MLGGVLEMETNCGNGIAENGGKKKDATFTTNYRWFSYYWFKFEPNTKITFLPQ